MHKLILAQYQEDIKALFDIAGWQYVGHYPSDYFSIGNVISYEREIGCDLEIKADEEVMLKWKMEALDFDTKKKVIIEGDRRGNIIFQIMEKGIIRVKVECSNLWFIDLDCKVYGKLSKNGTAFIEKIMRGKGNIENLENELRAFPEINPVDFIAKGVMQNERVQKILKYLKSKTIN